VTVPAALMFCKYRCVSSPGWDFCRGKRGFSDPSHACYVCHFFPFCFRLFEASCIPVQYRVYAYACLYASLMETPISSLTITFIVSHFPRNLFAHLKKVRGCKVEETCPGIYTVNGDILPMQVIDSRKLSAYENLWLEGLRKQLSPLEVIRLAKGSAKQEKAHVRVFMSAIATANFKAVEEAMNMSSAAKSLEEVLVRTGITAREKERNSLEIAQNLINLGYPLEDIASATRIDIEKVKDLSKGKIYKP